MLECLWMLTACTILKQNIEPNTRKIGYQRTSERTNGRTGRPEFIGLILPTRVGWEGGGGGGIKKLHSIFVL